MNNERAIILALVRSVIAANPNDAVCHQIIRLYKNAIETDSTEFADRLHELLNPTETEDFKIVQSTSPLSDRNIPLQDAEKMFDENADCFGRDEAGMFPAMSREKFIELWQAKQTEEQLNKNTL